jgi:hypothetical protein
MKKPFIVINFEDKEVMVIVKAYCRTISFDSIGDNEDFFYELFRKYKSVNFASKFSDMGKKDFLSLLDDLSEAIKLEVKEVEPEALAFQEPASQEIIEDTEFRYIMSNTEKRFSVEDLGVVFSHKAENYEISLIGKDKIDKSEYLKVFIKNGMIVMATASMVREAQAEYNKMSRSSRSKSHSLGIVDREEIDVTTGASDMGRMDISDEHGDTIEGIEGMGSEDAGSFEGAEYDAFANTTGDKSLDSIMKSMKR